MSDLEVVPPRPSCPICTTNNQTERDGGRWLCGHCWTVFSGGQGEWERSRDQRETYRKLDEWRRAVTAAKETAA